MKNSLASACLAALAGLGLPAMSLAANVGYYDMCTGTGNPVEAAAITASGNTPINVDVPDAATLSTLKGLFVTNCSNGGYGAEYIANFAAIDNAVTTQGLVLILHDRTVSGAGAVLPGSAGISFVGGVYGSNVDFPPSSPILTGPGGTLNDTSLDGGTSSTHGYVDTAGLPAGSRALAYEASPTRLATVSYPRGTGKVVYSTIPLDYYLAGGGPQPVQSNMKNIYAPNVIAWAVPSFVSCAATGLLGAQLTMCKQICEMPQSPTSLTGLIKLYTTLYRSNPPCAN